MQGIMQTMFGRADGTVSMTKVGAWVGTIGTILVDLGNILTGKVDVLTGLQALEVPVGALLVLVGIRNALPVQSSAVSTPASVPQ